MFEILCDVLLTSFFFVTAAASRLFTSRTSRKLLSFRFLIIFFLVGFDHLPLGADSPSSSPELSSCHSSRSPCVLGVRADVILLSTVVEVTETVPPPTDTQTAGATATAAPPSDGGASPSQATTVATGTQVAAVNTLASVTASRPDGSQPTASGAGQVAVQGSGTAEAGSTTVGTQTMSASSLTNAGEVRVSGLAGTKTAFVPMPATPSDIMTSSIRGTTLPTPTPSSALTPKSKFPTYAAGLASGTAIIVAAGLFTAIFLLRRRRRRHGPRKPSPVNEIVQLNDRPCSLQKVSDVISMPNLIKPDSSKLTSMEPPPGIDPETSWPRGHIPPDPEALREKMAEERNSLNNGVADLGIGYVPAGETPGDSVGGYSSPYTHGPGAISRPLSEMSLPNHMKHIMTPLRPRRAQGSVPEPINRLGAMSQAQSSIYSRDMSRRESVVTNFGDIHARIDESGTSNPQKERYRLLKGQLGTYNFVEEESSDEWSGGHGNPLQDTKRPNTARMQEYDRPHTAEHSSTSPVAQEFGQHDVFFPPQHASVSSESRLHHQDDYFSTKHPSTMNPNNRGSEYEDIDLSREDTYAEEPSNNDRKRRSGGYFGRFFGLGSAP